MLNKKNGVAFHKTTSHNAAILVVISISTVRLQKIFINNLKQFNFTLANWHIIC